MNEERERIERKKKLSNKPSHLELAENYELYLQESEIGLTFSTFENDFGCDKENANKVFRIVDRIRGAADIGDQS